MPNNPEAAFVRIVQIWRTEVPVSVSSIKYKTVLTETDIEIYRATNFFILRPLSSGW